MKGYPQGKVFSPFCLVLDGLLLVLNKISYKTVTNADDIATLISGKLDGALSEVMQVMTVATKKDNRSTHSLPFARKKNLNELKDIFLHQKKNTQTCRGEKIFGIYSV